MKRSESRILTSHTGSLYLPPRDDHGPTIRPTERDGIKEAVGGLVAKQVEVGVDIVNNGDLGAGLQVLDLKGVLDGVERAPLKDGEALPRGRPDVDMETYFEYYRGQPSMSSAIGTTRSTKQVCVGPLEWKGEEAAAWDIATLKEATAGERVEEVFMDCVSPGWLPRLVWNEYYPSDQEYVFAAAEALKPYYKAVVDAGFILQVDSPDIVDDWTWDRSSDLGEYRKHLEMRIDALNTAIEGLPEDRIRLHVCWGSWHGPHSGALPLQQVIDLAFKVRAECFSIEAAKPNHIHEWRVFEDFKLPDGKILMPGVIDHTTPVIEHPQAIADRIVTYANIVGKENVIAGTDCGMRIDSRLEWAKLAAMADGAAIATKALFA